MKLIFDHVFGKQEHQDLVVCNPLAEVMEEEENAAIESGWLALDVPIKGMYMIKDCKLWAEKYTTEFKFNYYFPIITFILMRCVLVAEKKKFAQIFIDRIFDTIWKDGLNLNDETVLKKILKTLDINPDIFLTEAEEVGTKNKLIEKTEEAFQKGIFGSPSFIINNKIFWGQDRLEFVISEAKK